MIPVKNVYYMLSYVFKVLKEQGYKSIETEEFHNVAELCAAILTKGVALQLKRGLGKEYISESEALSSPRGKIDVTASIKDLSMIRGQLECTYDDFSVNSYMNRIIKSTLELLLKAKIPSTRKKDIKKVLIFFGDVNTLDIYSINWSMRFNRNNQSYRMLVAVCELMIKGLLQTKSDGSTKMMDFLDEQHMHRLYEKFILEYFRKEHPQLTANASQIPWQLDDDMSAMLPVMQTDIMLSQRERILIIDAKYYAHVTQRQYDKNTIHSGNLYQIFTYVKNKELELNDRPHEVSGMLLYAKTDEEIVPDNEYRMSGNKIAVRTLDLSGDFPMIKVQLDGIAEKYFYTNAG